MNNDEFNRLEKVLSQILKELQIQNKLRALQLTQTILDDDLRLIKANNKSCNELLKEIEQTLNGYGLKEMTNDE